MGQISVIWVDSTFIYGKEKEEKEEKGREEEDFKGGMGGLGTGRQFCRASVGARPDLAWPDG